MSFFEDAIQSLGVTGYVIKGFIKNEDDFNANFYKVVGQEPNGTGILSNDPSDFGVTWKQIDDQIKIEEQKFKDTQYQRDRADTYPELKEQLDLLWHAIDGGKFNVKSKDTDFYKKLKAVKDANPKPE